MSDSARADKWLWAVRLFKTRRLAADTCAAGKVRRGGRAIKASTPLRVNDLLDVPFSEGPGVRSIQVASLIEKRVSAAEARACFDETTLADVFDAQKQWHQARVQGARGRPTKKERREISRIRDFFG